jgi:putative phosphoesterase
MSELVRIGVLSDTHLTLGDARLPALLVDCQHHFAGTELVLHAGDVVDPQLLPLLPQPLLAVRGNLDPPELPERRIIPVAGKRIGLIHGWGAKYDLEERILRAFSGEQVDCIVYGHSHQPTCHVVNGILLFNPGSPTDRRNAPFHSLGILTISDGITGEIIVLDE